MVAETSKIIIHTETPCGVLYGTNFPPTESDVKKHDIKRVNAIVITKRLLDIDDNPAAKHSKSSGKNGSKNIVVKKTVSTPLKDRLSLLDFPLPKIKETTLTPSLRDTKNAVIEPKNIPPKLISAPLKTPKIITAALVVKIDGNGNTTTCKNCKTKVIKAA